MADQEPFAGMAQEDTLALVQNVMVRILDAVGHLTPDALSRLRVNVEAGTVTISSGTVTIASGTVTNQQQMGGYAANQQIPILNLLGEGDIRRNIVIS